MGAERYAAEDALAGTVEGVVAQTLGAAVYIDVAGAAVVDAAGLALSIDGSEAGQAGGAGANS